MNGSERAALEPSLDGRLAYLARAIRTATVWVFTLEVIDLRAATIVDRIELLSIPLDPSNDTGIAGRPTLRIAPDGRHALVMSAYSVSDAPGRSSVERHGWIIDIDGDAFGRVVAADAIAEADRLGELPPCSWTAFVTSTMIARGCPSSGSGTAYVWSIDRFDIDGRGVGPIVLDPALPRLDTPLLDTSAGLAYAWDPVDLTLIVVDLVNGSVRSTALPPDERANPDAVRINGPRPTPSDPVIWSDGRDSTALAARARWLTGSPDGRLVFAIGVGSRPVSSSGVLVFDVTSLALVERWPARSSYQSVTVFGDGRWLAAIGRASATASGGAAEWGQSVTIHESGSGVAVLRIANLGSDGALALRWPGPLAVTP